jgi:hypothetical protein
MSARKFVRGSRAERKTCYFTGLRQTGHMATVRSHLWISCSWKRCAHGRVVMRSPSPKGSRQITHDFASSADGAVFVGVAKGEAAAELVSGRPDAGFSFAGGGDLAISCIFAADECEFADDPAPAGGAVAVRELALALADEDDDVVVDENKAAPHDDDDATDDVVDRRVSVFDDDDDDAVADEDEDHEDEDDDDDAAADENEDDEDDEDDAAVDEVEAAETVSGKGDAAADETEAVEAANADGGAAAERAENEKVGSRERVNSSTPRPFTGPFRSSSCSSSS